MLMKVTKESTEPGKQEDQNVGQQIIAQSSKSSQGRHGSRSYSGIFQNDPVSMPPSEPLEDDDPSRLPLLPLLLPDDPDDLL